MMQPLADMYFLTVLEYMKDEKVSGMLLETALLSIEEVQDVSYKFTYTYVHIYSGTFLIWSPTRSNYLTELEMQSRFKSIGK